MKNITKIIFCMILIILFSIQVYSIGISPSRIIILFEPNKEETFEYYVINRENVDTNVQIYSTGKFSEYVTLHETNMKVGAGETKSFSIAFKMPPLITQPGTYDTRIGVVEVAGGDEFGEGATVGAVTGVESQLYVRVPYPGKYISIRLDIGELVVDQPMIFKIIVESLGKEDINSISGIITIYDPEENELAKLDTTTKTLLKSGEVTELYAKWKPKNLKPGVYKAVAVVHYDEKIVETESKFNIGDLIVEVVNVSSGVFEQNKINKFDIGVQSLWNEVIDDIYAEIEIKDVNKNMVSSFKTENTDIKPWSFKTISAYWDTTNVPVGIYDANIILNYEGKQSKRSFEFSVVKSRGLETIYIVIGGLVLLIIILMLWIFREYFKHKKAFKR